ncbi:hypothetical protein PoB_007541200 [Plakobranchus ocellatus]|uniref:Secreted protein n=1 Tax=Plakobranchus ocellatus TaxID=259542 RepID=A0AAV4DY00_9GAST|nr:hypothetical protein PoB_007541200 [Plakobranchus ocellatus]
MAFLLFILLFIRVYHIITIIAATATATATTTTHHHQHQDYQNSMFGMFKPQSNKDPSQTCLMTTICSETTGVIINNFDRNELGDFSRGTEARLHTDTEYKLPYSSAKHNMQRKAIHTIPSGPWLLTAVTETYVSQRTACLPTYLSTLEVVVLGVGTPCPGLTRPRCVGITDTFRRPQSHPLGHQTRTDRQTEWNPAPV